MVRLDGKRAERFCVVCGLVVESGVVVPYKLVVAEHARRAHVVARERGSRVGGPRKELERAEVVLLRQLREERSWGWKRLADVLNELRGVAQIADPKLRRLRKVSCHTVSRRLGRDDRNTYPRFPRGTGKQPFAAEKRRAAKAAREARFHSAVSESAIFPDESVVDVFGSRGTYSGADDLDSGAVTTEARSP